MSDDKAMADKLQIELKISKFGCIPLFGEAEDCERASMSAEVGIALAIFSPGITSITWQMVLDRLSRTSLLRLFSIPKS